MRLPQFGSQVQFIDPFKLKKIPRNQSWSSTKKIIDSIAIFIDMTIGLIIYEEL